MDGDIVIIKGRKNRISFQLDENGSFENVKKALQAKLIENIKFFGTEKLRVEVEGRILNKAEKEEIRTLLLSTVGINVSNLSFVEEGESQLKIPKVAEQEDSVGATDILNKYISQLSSEQMTTFHIGSLRSGHRIEYDGSVVVLGDVNPGAEIVAGGNVIVLGYLRGLVHAGFNGQEKSFVSALRLEPIQLRIGNIITYIPESILKKRKAELNPCYAYIHEGKIYITELTC